MGVTYMTIEDKQKASLEVLLYLDSFCKKKHIRYYLAYGTLIGAVRHKGFIPWDDDVDVHIPRPDYERLLTDFSDPTGNFELVSCFNDKEYILPYAKIQNLNTARVLRGGELDHQGIGIDLFPLDGISGDIMIAEKLFLKQNNHWLKVTNRLERFREIHPQSCLDYAKSLVGRGAFSIGYLSKSIKKFSKSPLGYQYDDADKVGTLVGIHSGKFRAFDREWFNPIEMEFEGHLLPVPDGYHNILSSIYGDYMQLPPEEYRVTTHTDKFVWRRK